MTQGKCQICGAKRKLVKRASWSSRNTKFQSYGDWVINEHTRAGVACRGGMHPPIEFSRDLLRQHIAELQGHYEYWQPAWIGEGKIVKIGDTIGNRPLYEKVEHLKRDKYVVKSVALPAHSVAWATLEDLLDGETWQGRLLVETHIWIGGRELVRQIHFTREVDATLFTLVGAAFFEAEAA